MSRLVNKLTSKSAKSINTPGRHSDGGGLFLRVRKSGFKSWLFMSTKNGKRTELSLGDFDTLSLANAREEASQFRKRLSQGLPLVEIILENEIIPTFIDCAKQFLATKEDGWKNEKHRAQWHMTLNVYAEPLHKLLVSEITTPDVVKVLQPIWLSKQETASRLRGRIEAVLDYSKAMGWRSGENPATWRGNLKLILPHYSKTRNVKHHPALPFEEMGSFYSKLVFREASVARLLEFTILTASRSGEARDARWNEINLQNMTWTIPAERMKMNREHIVPLSTRIIQILRELHIYNQDDYIFLHPTRKVPFSSNSTRALLKRMNFGHVTTHGFRSTF